MIEKEGWKKKEIERNRGKQRQRERDKMRHTLKEIQIKWNGVDKIRRQEFIQPNASYNKGMCWI